MALALYTSKEVSQARSEMESEWHVEQVYKEEKEQWKK